MSFRTVYIAITAITLDFVCGISAAAIVKINKMADVGFPRLEGKQGEFLLIFSNNGCIIK